MAAAGCAGFPTIRLNPPLFEGGLQHHFPPIAGYRPLLTYLTLESFPVKSGTKKSITNFEEFLIMKSLRTLINGVLAGTGTAFVGLVLATGLMALPVETAHAQWFRCGSGELQMQGNPPNRARCRVTHAPPGCPKVGGFELKRDYVQNIDHCVPAYGPHGQAECAPGQQVQRVTGRDRCYSYGPVNTPG